MHNKPNHYDDTNLKTTKQSNRITTATLKSISKPVHNLDDLANDLTSRYKKQSRQVTGFGFKLGVVGTSVQNI